MSAFSHVDVPEAIVTDDGKDLQFKFITKTEDDTTHTVLRTHAQLTWLDSKLGQSHKGLILPSLPEAPNSSMLNEADHVEKKRRQFQRYISKILERQELIGDEDLQKFLVTPVVTTEKPTDTLGMASSMATNMATGMFSSLTTKSESGIRIYKPTSVIDDVDETEFERRKMHILQAEKDHKAVLEAISAKIRIRNALGRSFLLLGENLSELDTPPQNLGGKIRHFNEFGIRMAGLHHEQFKEEVFHFGDVVLEYRNNANVKALLNRRTELVAEGDANAKALVKSNENIEKVKKKHSESTPEFAAANEEREKTKEKIESHNRNYEDFKKNMRQEFDRFETKKQSDFKEALDHYVKTQINLESKKLEALTQLLRHITE